MTPVNLERGGAAVADREDARLDETHILEGMIAIAVAAGEAILSARRVGLTRSTKDDASPVTSADLAAEAVIAAGLASLAPDVPVVSEERADLGSTKAPAVSFFVVDPLDGTREFVAGRPDFTVNIALVRHGAPVCGVVYAPDRGDLYAGMVAAAEAFHRAAGAGAGAVARRALRVRSATPDGVVAVASRSHRSAETDMYLARLGVRTTVSAGSSLKFCLLADGQADVYPRFGRTMEWDTAAGQAVLEAAGGRVLVADRKPLSYGKPGWENPWFIATAGQEGYV